MNTKEEQKESSPERGASAGEASGPITLDRFERSPRLAELKVAYRSRTKAESRHPIRGAGDVERYLRAVWNRGTLDLIEDFVVVCLNGNHQAIGWVKVSTGGMTGAQVDPRVVFAVALQTASIAIIVAHNHPSGNLAPSDEDRVVTRRLKEAGNLLGIKVLDHLILTRESSFSFAENGLR